MTKSNVTRFILVISSLTLLSFSIYQRPSIQIESGIGSNELKIGDVMDSVYSKIGKPDKVQNSIACGPNTLNTYRHSYSNQGITIISIRFDKQGVVVINNLVTQIIYHKPIYLESINGISWIENSKSYVVTTFGVPDYEKTTRSNKKHMMYRNKGISFEYDVRTEEIESIEIFVKGGYASFEG